jgi:uncharacterized pyridoxamine 5'-phosphate oxidase family protein
MNAEIKTSILEFFKKHRFTVVATIDSANNRPESAVVGFAETENLELIFGTSNLTRKYKNLQTNQNVSFVIGWDPALGTIQYEGVAQELSREEGLKYAEILVAKNPFSKTFMERPDQRYFLVKPTWLRFTDMSKKPEQVTEISF